MTAHLKLVEAVPCEAPPRIGPSLDDILADWGLGVANLELRDAVALLLNHGGPLPGVGRLKACGVRMRDAMAVPPDAAVARKLRDASRISSGAASTMFRLTVRQFAVLVELRFAAMALSQVEKRDHLTHALKALDDVLAEAARSSGEEA